MSDRRSDHAPDLSAGLCRTAGRPDWWFSKHPPERLAALSICRACPVLAACREWALRFPATDSGGIVGGMRPYDRQLERRRRRQLLRESARQP